MDDPKTLTRLIAYRVPDLSESELAPIAAALVGDTISAEKANKVCEALDALGKRLSAFERRAAEAELNVIRPAQFIETELGEECPSGSGLRLP
jgi:hypothetical protein